jgi:hypothetical protein
VAVAVVALKLISAGLGMSVNGMVSPLASYAVKETISWEAAVMVAGSGHPDGIVLTTDP